VQHRCRVREMLCENRWCAVKERLCAAQVWRERQVMFKTETSVECIDKQDIKLKKCYKENLD
jgi:hypothetical protein